ncbi:MAG: TolC family protein [Candidatus Aminicenantes bacterium]
MKIKASFIAVFILILFFRPCYSEEEEVLSLTLEECVIRTLKDNLNVAVEVINPDLADASVTKAKETFMPRLDIGFGNERIANPSSWWLEQADTVINKDMNYSATLVQPIPTGGNFSLSLNNNRYETNSGFQVINPRYGSTLRFGLTQPLLKNFGFKVSRKEIIVAQNNLDISIRQFEKTLLDTIYRVQEAYWNLVYAIDDYNVKQQSLQLAQDLLAKNKKEVEVGKLAEIEILNAEAVVASREADILQAEALIRRSEDVLKDLLNLTAEGEMSPEKIVPLDKPSFIQKEISLEEALREALEKNPDLEMLKKTLETNELNLDVAKNQLLPGLDLEFSYWSPGLSGTEIVFDPLNPFGPPIGTIDHPASDALKDAFGFKYNNWSVGLTLSLPLSSFTTKADYVRAKMEIEKSQLELINQEKQVYLEVKNAVRDVETNYKRVQAYRLARELAEKRLEAEVKKLDVGLTTNYFVLQYQEELSRERSLELKSLVDYNLALARLEKAMGTSLEKRNIVTSQFLKD